MSYKVVREPATGKFLFCFDEERDIIEVRRSGKRYEVRLDDLRNNKSDPISYEGRNPRKVQTDN